MPTTTPPVTKQTAMSVTKQTASSVSTRRSRQRIEFTDYLVLDDKQGKKQNSKKINEQMNELDYITYFEEVA